ncbi:hypothetical protein BdWA1_000358 [Babesia duncani]|uniref:Uncharacterized protein n=1 Tax=Babesia duncani TaxID=323732 RepID=A0AAD9PMA7_9APIC|nr:hypothetical protein BdWA1_000358 [Babesia duncani]
MWFGSSGSHKSKGYIYVYNEVIFCTGVKPTKCIQPMNTVAKDAIKTFRLLQCKLAREDYPKLCRRDILKNVNHPHDVNKYDYFVFILQPLEGISRRSFIQGMYPNSIYTILEDTDEPVKLMNLDCLYLKTLLFPKPTPQSPVACNRQDSAVSSVSAKLQSVNLKSGNFNSPMHHLIDRVAQEQALKSKIEQWAKTPDGEYKQIQVLLVTLPEVCHFRVFFVMMI